VFFVVDDLAMGLAVPPIGGITAKSLELMAMRFPMRIQKPEDRIQNKPAMLPILTPDS
jgi:hypothetical protein